MELKKFLKKHKAVTYIVSGVIALALAALGYLYFSGRLASEEVKVEDTTPAISTQTDAQVQQNITDKSQAVADPTTTPSVVTDKPQVTTLEDVSFTILRDGDKAYVTFYGPFGTYGVEKLTGSSWSVIVSEFAYSGKGGRDIDTIDSTDAESHYRVFKLEGGSKVATSGDTVILWQDVLTKGAFSVPLTR